MVLPREESCAILMTHLRRKLRNFLSADQDRAKLLFVIRGSKSINETEVLDFLKTRTIHYINILGVYKITCLQHKNSI